MKKITVLFFSILLTACSISPCFATGNRLVDEANLLSEEEKIQVSESLDSFSEERNFDIVIVTKNGLDGKDIKTYADDFYDENGYGYGESLDGCLLLIDMVSRNYWISTMGYGNYALSGGDFANLESKFVPYLSNGDYYGAFNTFISGCGEIIAADRNDELYNGIQHNENRQKDWQKIILIGIGIGMILAFIPVTVMRAKMKTAKLQSGAANYLQEGSLNITSSRDIYLYSTVTKTPRETTHSSSSGSSSGHGGGGGKF